VSTSEGIDQFATLVGVIARLRASDGCPWDRQQTHTSLRGSLLEECYEVLEALDAGDSAHLCEELGDLLMQIVFHIQIATEAGEFELADVLKNINAKLVKRHPHVFGSIKVETAADVALNWEILKRDERAHDSHALASVPRQLPALSYSQRIQDRVARLGFDWADVGGVIAKLAEEVEELGQVENQAQREWEFGDLLFTLVNVGRWLGVDPESALRQANTRFSRRFSAMEDLCHRRGVNIGDLTFAEQNVLWAEVKERESQ